jgi:6-pyruvoyltetrahydropterin/6-carboxytetrahydropterin synthase
VRISKEVEFDAGHRVPNHASKCRNPHGHRYRVRATCEGDIVEDPTSPEFGMLVDFSALKGMLVEHVHDRFDHATIVHRDDHEFLGALDGHGWKVEVVSLVPTAENLARLIFGELAWRIANEVDGLRLVEVAVWETPTSVAYVTQQTGGPIAPRTLVELHQAGEL